MDILYLDQTDLLLRNWHYKPSLSTRFGPTKWPLSKQAKLHFKYSQKSKSCVRRRMKSIIDYPELCSTIFSLKTQLTGVRKYDARNMNNAAICEMEIRHDRLKCILLNGPNEA